MKPHAGIEKSKDRLGGRAGRCRGADQRFDVECCQVCRALTPSVQDLQDVVLGSQQLTRLAEELKELAEKLLQQR